MRIGIVDADLLGRKKHRFPNLVSEKISAYMKEQGHQVELITSYNVPSGALITEEQYSGQQEAGQLMIVDPHDEPADQNIAMKRLRELFPGFDKVYVSKVFTDTPVPRQLYDVKYDSWPEDETGHREPQDPNAPIQIGGTGFFFDKAPKLQPEIEHHMPDYHLYDDWIESEVARARAAKEAVGLPFNEKKYREQFKEYTDYSIGFLTRGCFRRCKFCVNQNYTSVGAGTPLANFYDETRKKICLLDDNFLGYGLNVRESLWEPLLEELISTGKQFKFKQGMDERILDDKMCKMLFHDAKYDGDFTFAFDNYKDYNIIKRKLEFISQYRTKQSIKFYVLCAFVSTDIVDVRHTFARIALLFEYKCLPYIMRYQNKDEKPYLASDLKPVYVTLARWCNQPSFVKKKSFREFCEANQAVKTNQTTECSAMTALHMLESYSEEDFPKAYLDMKYGDPVTIANY